MADREYKIELKIEGDASGSAPVDAGLKRVEEGAKRAEDALKQVEDQSRRTDQAVSSTGSKSPGAAFGVGSNGLPLPDKVRSWHSPEEAAAIERIAGSMRAVTTEAAAMEGATAQAATAFGSLGTGAIAVGGALTLVLGTVVAGALPEFKELGSAVGDLGLRFARAASEAIGLPSAIKGIADSIKEYSGAADEERAQEQKVANAKLEAALARQKVAMAAREEKAAIEEVSTALRDEIQLLEIRDLADDERSRTVQEVRDAEIELERAKLENTPGLSREERVTRKAEIDEKERVQKRQQRKEDLERALQDEKQKVEAVEEILQDAQKSGNPAAIARAQEAADRQRKASSEKRVRINGALERLDLTGPAEAAAAEERKQAAIRDARTADSEELQSDIDDEVREYMKRTGIKDKYLAKKKKEEEKAAAKEERESMARAKRRVVGDDAWDGSFDYNTRFPNPFNDASDDGQKALKGTRKIRQAIAGGRLGDAGNEDTMALVGKLEQAAAGLADGVATGEERKVFNDALLRLANAISRIAPGMASGLRDLRQEIEPRLKKIEEDIATQNMGSTK